MAVRFGSARIDENGNARGGAAGDQNGKEVSTQGWYKHAKGWRVFRAIEPEAREKIAECMEMACVNPNIGYDQNQRGTLYAAAEPFGFDVSKVDKKVETDCSALVRVCLAYAGIMVGNFNTASQAKVLLATGKIKEMVGSKYTDKPDNLLAGDILVTRTQGHTVVVIEGADGAKDTDVPTTEVGNTVEIAAGSWNIRSGPGTEFPSIGIARGGEKYEKAEADSWVPVKTENGIGWISPKAVKGG